jgi:rhodanese-related sulfurtransferase
MHLTLVAIREQIEAGDGVFVDIRESSEWEKGHLKGACHLPLSKIEAKEFSALPKNKTLFLYCRQANRVKKALPILAETCPKLELIQWGFDDLWAAGFPVE